MLYIICFQRSDLIHFFVQGSFVFLLVEWRPVLTEVVATMVLIHIDPGAYLLDFFFLSDIIGLIAIQSLIAYKKKTSEEHYKCMSTWLFEPELDVISTLLNMLTEKDLAPDKGPALMKFNCVLIQCMWIWMMRSVASESKLDS